MLRGASVIVMLSAAAGCRTPVEPPRPTPTTPAGCTFGERKAAACELVRAAKVLDGKGAVMPSEVLSCGLGELSGDVTWAFGKARTPFQTFVRFGAGGPLDALRPVSVDPIVLEWPTEVLDPAPPRLHLAVPSSCAIGTVGTTPVDVSVGAVGPMGCVGVARETLGDLDWCSRPMVGEVEYAIREWYPWFHLRHRARLPATPCPTRDAPGAPWWI